MTSSAQKWILAGLLTALAGSPAFADRMYLDGTVRDFREAHPDMEDTFDGHFEVIPGMVKRALGPDNKPQLDLGMRAAVTIDVVADDHDLSNVVLNLWHYQAEDDDDDRNLHYKYDNLNDGKTGTFHIPDEYDGTHHIVGVWVKAGNNNSGDGPGYGEEIEGEDMEYFSTEEFDPDDEEQGDPTVEGETVTVTFISDVFIPRPWRIQSEDTFNQWFRCNNDENETTVHTIALDSVDGEIGGKYRFRRSVANSRPFYPIDDQLFGNEGHPNNNHFTFEVKARFTYTGEPLTLAADASDDLWVFINGVLAVDLGGVHPEAMGEVNINAQTVNDLGVKKGVNEMRIFYAHRHTQSPPYLTIETNMALLPHLGD